MALSESKSQLYPNPQPPIYETEMTTQATEEPEKQHHTDNIRDDQSEPDDIDENSPGDILQRYLNVNSCMYCMHI